MTATASTPAADAVHRRSASSGWRSVVGPSRCASATAARPAARSGRYPEAGARRDRLRPPGRPPCRNSASTGGPGAVQTGAVHEDPDRCYLAVQSRDPRFDGWFVTAVTSTGIYCRPSCPARTPHRRNVRFLPTAAAAQRAGFRACKRCRPDATPGSPEWDGRADVVARAMRLIADGVIDRSGVPGLAARLGYSVRQLERLLLAEVGAGPVALARAQRAQTARILIETTDLPMTEVAFAAGFSSIRQFNDTVRAVFARPALGPAGRGARRRCAAAGRGRRAALVLRLPVPSAARARTPSSGTWRPPPSPGSRRWSAATYRRTLAPAPRPGHRRPDPDAGPHRLPGRPGRRAPT